MSQPRRLIESNSDEISLAEAASQSRRLANRVMKSEEINLDHFRHLEGPVIIPETSPEFDVSGLVQAFLRSQMPSTTRIWYHAACNDGFAAATVLWGQWKDNAIYQACSYGSPLPESNPGDLVIMVDFSGSRSQIEGLRAAGIEVKILDHHKTAQAELEGLSDCIFDMNECGATLAWKWLHGDRPIPEFLKYIRDRDLWLKEFPETDLVRAGLEGVERSFPLWKVYFTEADLLRSLMKAGEAIKRVEKRTIEGAAKYVRMITLDGHVVPVVNTTSLMSDIGEHLCNQYPDAPFSATYRDGDKNRSWSLRSRSQFDVSEVAKKFGGGGHRGAAGFVTPIPGDILNPTS